MGSGNFVFTAVLNSITECVAGLCFLYNSDLLPLMDGTKTLSLKEVKCFKFRFSRNGIMRFKFSTSGFFARRTRMAMEMTAYVKFCFVG